MKTLGFDYQKALGFFSEEEFVAMKDYVKVAHNMLHNKTSPICAAATAMTTAAPGAKWL